MQTPEEVARDVAKTLYIASHDDREWAAQAWDDMGGSEPSEERALLELAALDLIRARDAEVAAAQRDVTLVSFEWETTPGPVGTWNAPARRLVGPWEPVEP